MTLNELKIKIRTLLATDKLSDAQIAILKTDSDTLGLSYPNLLKLIDIEKENRNTAPKSTIGTTEVLPENIISTKKEYLNSSPNQIDNSQLNVVIQGAFHNPELLRSDSVGLLYAVNKETEGLIIKRQKDRKSFFLKTEFEITKHLQHANLYLPLKLANDSYSTYLQFPWLPLMSLESWLSEKKQLSTDQLTTIFFELLASLAYLHSQNVSHLYINPRTIYISNNGKPILYGVGAYANVSLSRYASYPELYPKEFSTKEANLQTDVYELGKLFFLLLKYISPNEKNSRQLKILSLVAGKASEKKPLNRYSTAIIMLQSAEVLLLSPANKSGTSKFSKLIWTAIISGIALLIIALLYFI